MTTVVFINAELAIGGAEVVLARQCEILARNGVSVHVICTNNFGAIGRKIAKTLAVHDLSKFGKKTKIENIINIFNLVKPDIVYVNNVNIVEAIHATKRDLKYKLIVQIHGCIENSKNFASKILACYASSIDIIISPHLKTHGMAQKRYGRNSVMLLNPIDKRFYETSVDIEKKNIIGYCGRISPEKNLTLLAKITALVLETVNDVSLMIIGDADEKDPESVECKSELINAMKSIDVPFRITGFRDDYYEYLAKIKVGVLLSHHEGFSNFLWEASALGIPVISTNVGSSYLLLSPNDIIKTKDEADLVQKFAARITKHLLYRDNVDKRAVTRELASRAHQDNYEKEFMELINGAHRS